MEDNSGRRLRSPYARGTAPIIKEIYQLGDILGKGAYGTVFRGLNIKTGEVVAIKQIEKKNIREDQMPSIMQELEMLQNLYHPNVVTFIDFSDDKKYLYFILEFVEGGNLHEAMVKFGKFSETLLVIYVAQVLRGLCYLHERGVIHRDIKGANILLTKEGTVKLADFGSCSYAAVVTNDLAGTPFWMAPEVIGKEESKFGADIWSLGCTILELLTGAAPYWKLGADIAMYRMVEDEHPPIPPEVSPELTEFLLACFIRDPDKRPAAEELLQFKWIRSLWYRDDELEDANSPNIPKAVARAIRADKVSKKRTVSLPRLWRKDNVHKEKTMPRSPLRRFKDEKVEEDKKEDKKDKGEEKEDKDDKDKQHSSSSSQDGGKEDKEKPKEASGSKTSRKRNQHGDDVTSSTEEFPASLENMEEFEKVWRKIRGTVAQGGKFTSLQRSNLRQEMKKLEMNLSPQQFADFLNWWKEWERGHAKTPIAERKSGSFPNPPVDNGTDGAAKDEKEKGGAIPSIKESKKEKKRNKDLSKRKSANLDHLLSPGRNNPSDPRLKRDHASAEMLREDTTSEDSTDSSASSGGLPSLRPLQRCETAPPGRSNVSPGNSIQEQKEASLKSHTKSKLTTRKRRGSKDKNAKDKRKEKKEQQLSSEGAKVDNMGTRAKEQQQQQNSSDEDKKMERREDIAAEKDTKKNNHNNDKSDIKNEKFSDDEQTRAKNEQQKNARGREASPQPRKRSKTSDETDVDLLPNSEPKIPAALLSYLLPYMLLTRQSEEVDSAKSLKEQVLLETELLEKKLMLTRKETAEYYSKKLKLKEKLKQEEAELEEVKLATQGLKQNLALLTTEKMALHGKLDTVKEAAAKIHSENVEVLQELKEYVKEFSKWEEARHSKVSDHSVEWLQPGAKCQALCSVDGFWRDAVILTRKYKRLSPNATNPAKLFFDVVFIESGIEEALKVKHIKAPRKTGWGLVYVPQDEDNLSGHGVQIREGVGGGIGGGIGGGMGGGVQTSSTPTSPLALEGGGGGGGGGMGGGGITHQRDYYANTLRNKKKKGRILGRK